MEIRRFEEKDAQAVSALIAKTLRTTNIKDYSPEFIEHEVSVLTPEYIAWRASWTHFYVACEDESVIGCGAIGPYWGSETESSLFTIFVLPEHQHQGYGRQLMEAALTHCRQSGLAGKLTENDHICRVEQKL